MLHKNDKLEPRNENEQSFNIKNKTDRKILSSLLIALGIAVVLLAGLIVVYYKFFAI